MYKAMLDSGQVLTVKWLREGIAEGRKEFAREVKKLGDNRRPNRVSMLGYYSEPKEHEKLFILIYVNAQSLAFHFHGKTLKIVHGEKNVSFLQRRHGVDSYRFSNFSLFIPASGMRLLNLSDSTEAGPRKFSPLSLEERLRISVDVARCPNFLHNEKAILHGNLKSTNILLETPTLNALLTDYSVHRILTPSKTTEQVLNAGVYAFGVTGKSSGEIVSGIPGVVNKTASVTQLAEENRCFECLDRLILERPRVNNPPRVLDGMLQVALRCIHPASERPDIKTVFQDTAKIVN
ncbi:hypothetical protein DVH24_003762 [Malus domestica]|uniref:Protein kinase domain-containing protein n=1 Tax=Malus domestica TaxID=3750 RepID=A0A498K4D2_MALDO|nr:hypothetical protein DVH24_003762 [Malus domestica]